MRRRTILIAVSVIILIWVSVVAIDYYRATQRQSPWFAFRTEFLNDGGTRIFSGLGYRITFYNQSEMVPMGRMDTVFWFFGFERTFPGVDSSMLK